MTSMDRECVHDELDRIIPPGNYNRIFVRAIGHALIDAGRLHVVECMYDLCVLPSRSFVCPSDERRTRRWRPVIDHVVELWQGGTDRLSNLQLIHFACNSSKTVQLQLVNPERREAMAAQLRERWQDSDYRTAMSHMSSNVSSNTRERRSQKMREHWADPEQRARHTAALSRGPQHHSRRSKDTTPVSCELCGRTFKGEHGLAVHRGRSH